MKNSESQALKDLSDLIGFELFLDHVKFLGAQRVYKIKPDHWSNKRSYSKDLSDFARKRYEHWSIDPDVHVKLIGIIYTYELSLSLDGLGGNKQLDKDWLKKELESIGL
jgi:hypothetical protein